MAKDICDLINIPNCPSVMKQSRRSSLQSLPSPGAAANLNPANVSFDRGLGVEFIHQPGNSMVYNLASGSGKLGGALISSSLENGFFGNRTIETDQSFLTRNEEKTQYDSKKLVLALGGRLFARKNFSLDVGLLVKRHKEIKDINTGLGVSARLNFLTLGASVYKDDFRILKKDTFPYSSGRDYDAALFVEDFYEEKFTVQTLSAGLRYRNFSLDGGLIKTKYDLFQEDSTIKIIAASFSYGRFLFNIARRNENSQSVKIEDDLLVYEKESTNYYSGIQASIGKHLILGISYNYFLLKEVAFSTTIFF